MTTQADMQRAMEQLQTQLTEMTRLLDSSEATRGQLEATVAAQGAALQQQQAQLEQLRQEQTRASVAPAANQGGALGIHGIVNIW